MFVAPRALPSPPRSTSNEEAAEEDLLSDLFQHRATPPPSPSTESSEEDEDGGEYGDEENNCQGASQKRSEIPPQRSPCIESNQGDEDKGNDSKNNMKESIESSSSEDEDGEHDRKQAMKKSCEAPPPRAPSTQSGEENKHEGDDSKNATQKNSESSSSRNEDGVDGSKEISQKNSEALPPPSPSTESSGGDEDEQEDIDRTNASKRSSIGTPPPPSPSTGSSDEDEEAEDSINAFQKNTEIPPPSSPSSKSNDERDGSKNASHQSRESTLAGDEYDRNDCKKVSQKRSEVPPPPSSSTESGDGAEEEDGSKYDSQENSQSLLVGKEIEDDRKPESQKCSEFLPPLSPSSESSDEDDNNNTYASQKRSEKPSAGDGGKGDISISDTYKRSLVQPPTSPYAESSDEDKRDDSSKETPSIPPHRHDVGTSGLWDNRVEGAEVSGSLLTELLAADPPGVKAVTEPTSTIVNATTMSPPSAAPVTAADRAERSPQPRQQTATEDPPILSLSCHQQGHSSSPVASDLEPAAPLPPLSPSRAPAQGHQRPARSRKQGQSCDTIATSESNTRLSSPTHERTQRQGAPSSSSRRGRSNVRGDHPLETSTAPVDADRQSLVKRVAQTKPERVRSNLVVRSVQEDHAPVWDDSPRGGEVASSFGDVTPPARMRSRRDQGRNTYRTISLSALSALRSSTPPLSPSSPTTLESAVDGESAVSTRRTPMSRAERSIGRSNSAASRISPGNLVTPPSVPANESKGSTGSTSKHDAPDASASIVYPPRPAVASRLLDAAAGAASLSSSSTRSLASVNDIDSVLRKQDQPSGSTVVGSDTCASDGDAQGEVAASPSTLDVSKTTSESANDSVTVSSWGPATKSATSSLPTPRRVGLGRRSSMMIGITSGGKAANEEADDSSERQGQPSKSGQRCRGVPTQASDLEEGRACKKSRRKQTPREREGRTGTTSTRGAVEASSATVCRTPSGAADGRVGSVLWTQNQVNNDRCASDADSQGEAAESLSILNDSRTKADSASCSVTVSSLDSRTESASTLLPTPHRASPRRRSSMTIGATSEGEAVVEESGELFDSQLKPRKSSQKPSQRRRRAPVQGTGLEEGKTKKKRPRKQTPAPRSSGSPPPLPARKMASESEGSTGTSPTHGDPEASTVTVRSRHLAAASRMLDVGAGAASSSSSSTRSGTAANGVGSVLRTQDQSGGSTVVGSDRCAGDGDARGEVAESSLLSNESRTTSESASGLVTVSSRGSPSKSSTSSLPTPRRVNYRRQSSVTTGATSGGTAADEESVDSSERQGPPSKSGQPSKRRRRAPVQGSGLEEEKSRQKRPRKQTPAPGSSVSPPPLPARKKVNSRGRSSVTTGAESGGTAANQEPGNWSERQGEPSKSVQRRRKSPAQGSGLEEGEDGKKLPRKPAPTSAPASGTSKTSGNVAGNDPHRMDDSTTGLNEDILSTTYEEDLALVRERQADYEGLLVIEAMVRREIVALQAEEDELRGFEGLPAAHQELPPLPPTPMLTLVPSLHEAQINMQKQGTCAKPDASARKAARKGCPSTEGARPSRGNVTGPEESSGVIGLGTHVPVPVSQDSTSNPIGSPAPLACGLPSGTSREGAPDLSGNRGNLDVTEIASGSPNTDDIDDIDGIAQSTSGTCEARPSPGNDDGPPETSRALGHVSVPTPPMGPSNDVLVSLSPPLPDTPVGTLRGLSVSSEEGDSFDMEGLLLGDDDSDDEKDGNALIVGGKQVLGSAALPLDRASNSLRAPERGREAVTVGSQGRGRGRADTAAGARGRGRGGRVSGIRPAPAKTGPKRPRYVDLNATYKRYDSGRGRGRRGGRGGNI